MTALATSGTREVLSGPADRVPAPTVRPRAPVALYVHVPFCVSACPYCDFVVYAGAAARGPRARTGAFLAGLAQELELRADALDATFGLPGPGSGRAPLRSVYLGGGTPSLLAAGEVGRFLAAVERRFGLGAGAEVTIELNPGPDERGDLAGFRAAGITRVSIGAQSLDPADLRRVGRRHRPEDVAVTVAAARRAGFTSVSLDLLYDLPGQTLAGWDRTLEAALALPIDHLSAYALTLDDPGAEGLTGATGDHLPTRSGARAWRVRARAGQDEGRAADMYALADERLAAAGFAWYEISNWARPGHESRHNLTYWRREPYEALGPGAHAFDGAGVRRWTAARLDGYLAALGEGRLPPGGSDCLDRAAIRAEGILLGLRLAEGVAWAGGGEAARGADAHAALGWAAAEAALEWAAANGLLERAAKGRVRLTLRGRLLLDEILARAG